MTLRIETLSSRFRMYGVGYMGWGFELSLRSGM